MFLLTLAKVKAMKKIEIYKDLLEKFCKNLTLTTFPHAQELMFRNIFLDELFYNIDVLEGKQTSGIYFKTQSNPFDIDVDEVVKRIDAEILRLQIEEEKERQHALIDAEIDKVKKKIENKLKCQNTKTTEAIASYDVEIHKKRKILLTGSAGSGKSILLKRLVLCCLNFGEESKELLKKYKNIIDENIINTIPIFIILNKLQLISTEEMKKMNLKNMLYKLSCMVLGEPFYSKIKEDDFIDILSQEKTTLFLDGLDEVLDDEKKSIFLSKLKGEKNEYNILLSTRTGDSDDEELFNNEAEFFYISEFVTKEKLADKINLKAVEGFAKNFYKVMFKFNPPEQDGYKDFIKQVENSSMLQKMIKTPFTLSLILSLFVSGQSLTENRAELLKKYVDLFLKWYSKKDRQTGLSETTVETLLSYVALYMLKSQKMMLDREELSNVLVACYRDMDGVFPEKMEISDVDVHIRELLTVGILDNRFVKYSFSQHRLLLEYFAAFAISKKICDDETYALTPLEFFSDKFANPKWKEVILYFCLMHPLESRKIIDSLISSVENTEDNYYLSNFLFELSSEVPIRTRERHKVYDSLFKEHITDRQIQLIISLLSSDTATAEDFIKYIREKFEESIKISGKKPYYNYAYAICVCYDLVKHETDPLWQAEKMLQSSDLIDVILGLEIYTILAWCRYMNIRNMFSIDSDVYRMYDRAIQSFKTLISNIDSFAMPGVIARAFQECVIAGFVSFSDIVDYDLYKKIVSDFSHNNDKDYLRTILSVFDFSHLPKDISVCENVRKTELDKLNRELEEKNQNAVFDFSVCAALGDFDKEIFEALYGMFENEKQISMERSRFLQMINNLTIHKTIREGNGKDHIAVEFFNHRLSDDGKKYFNDLTVDEPTEKLNANLSYYLRRGELIKIYKNHKEIYSTIELVFDYATEDALSIIEQSLILSKVAKDNFEDIEVGLNHLKDNNDILLSDYDTINQYAERWLNGINNNEAESIIVFYWLWSLGIFNIGSLSCIDQLINRITSDEKLFNQVFDLFVELTKYSRCFLANATLKEQDNLADVFEAEFTVLKGDIQHLESEVVNIKYTYIIDEENPSDVLLKKIVVEDGEKHLCDFDNDEYDTVYELFLKELVAVIRKSQT